MSKVRADQYTNKEGTGAPSFPNGVSVTGVLTATSFSGSLAGSASTATVATNAYGLVGSPNINVGSVTGTTGTFSGDIVVDGNISAGGTITYDDVTNVDSVGLITARTGIKVTTGGIDVTAGGIDIAAGGIDITGNIGLGGANYGTSGQVLTSGGSGANATWTTVEAAPTVTGVANGAIATDKAVIVENDGKLAEVLEQAVSASNSAITAAPDTNKYKAHPRVWSLGDYKFIQFWKQTNNNQKLYGCVGTVDPTTNAITYGSPIQIWNMTGTLNYDACVDSSTGNVFVTYHSGQIGDTVCVGMTISGTTITQHGTRLSLGQNISSVRCESNNNGGVLWLYHNGGTMYARGCTMASNGALAWGSSWSSLNIYNGDNTMSVAYDPDKDVFGIAYANGGQDGYAAIATINGTSASITGTASLQGGFHYDGVETVYDTLNKQFISTYRYTPNNYTKGITWYTNSGGTGFTVGTDFTITTNRLGTQTQSWSPSLGKSYLQINNDTVSGVSLITLTPSGTGQGTGFTSSQIDNIFANSPSTKSGMAAMNNGKVVVTASYGSPQVQTIVYQIAYSSTNLTSNNFLGFSKDSYTNGQTATVKINNNTTTTSGLSTNSVYYVQRDGTLGTTAANPSVLAGKALSSTSLIINLQQS